MTRIIISAVAGAVLSGVLGYFLLPVLRALKAGQSIREVGPTWHNHKAGTPMMGGLMFIGALIICLLVNAFTIGEYTVFYVLALGLCFGLVGFLDDFFKLKYKRNLGLTSLQKALLQAAVSALYLYLLYLEGSLTCDLYIPFAKITVENIHPILYIFFAMFVIVGCVNAVNLTDGVDGLCGSVTVPVMVFFTAAAVAKEKLDLALLPAILVGALIAYLFYNWHPAKVFMGDTGSLALGGAIGALSLLTQRPILLIVVAGICVVEALSDIIQVVYFKASHGKRVFKMAPLHHHLELCGWSEKKIVWTFWGITVALCAIGFLLV